MWRSCTDHEQNLGSGRCNVNGELDQTCAITELLPLRRFAKSGFPTRTSSSVEASKSMTQESQVLGRSRMIKSAIGRIARIKPLIVSVVTLVSFDGVPGERSNESLSSYSTRSCSISRGSNRLNWANASAMVCRGCRLKFNPAVPKGMSASTIITWASKRCDSSAATLWATTLLPTPPLRPKNVMTRPPDSPPRPSKVRMIESLIMPAFTGPSR